MSQNIGVWRRLPDMQTGIEADNIFPSSLEEVIVVTISLILEGLLVEPRWETMFYFLITSGIQGQQQFTSYL